jgi:hypothetical protein
MPALIAVGTFHSAIVYVLFMGFPVMNLAVGVSGGSSDPDPPSAADHHPA